MDNIVFGIIIGFLIILLVLLALAVFLKLYIKKTQAHKQALYQKEIEQQKAITETVIETQENTLDLIANELHDDAGQQLTYINLQLEQLKLQYPKLLKTITPLSESVGQLSNSIRTLSHTISHQKLKHNSLTQSITTEIKRLNKLNAVKCTFNYDKDFNYTFTETERIILYRMFQEISNNMLKHSRATAYKVQLNQNPKPVFSFADNGVGFNPKTNELLTLKQRAALINYSFEVKSTPKNGTKITLTKID